MKTKKKKGPHANKRSIDLTGGYRALYRINTNDNGTEYLWLWAGPHPEYDRLLSNRNWET